MRPRPRALYATQMPWDWITFQGIHLPGTSPQIDAPVSAGQILRTADSVTGVSYPKVSPQDARANVVSTRVSCGPHDSTNHRRTRTGNQTGRQPRSTPTRGGKTAASFTHHSVSSGPPPCMCGKPRITQLGQNSEIWQISEFSLLAFLPRPSPRPTPLAVPSSPS